MCVFNSQASVELFESSVIKCVNETILLIVVIFALDFAIGVEELAQKTR